MPRIGVGAGAAQVPVDALHVRPVRLRHDAGKPVLTDEPQADARPKLVELVRAVCRLAQEHEALPGHRRDQRLQAAGVVQIDRHRCRPEGSCGFHGGRW